MEQAGVIIKVNEATLWITSFVTVKLDGRDRKNRNLRSYFDPSNLNKAVQREPFNYRTPDDIYDKLSMGPCFTCK